VTGIEYKLKMSAGVVTIYCGGRDRIVLWRCPNDTRPRYRYATDYCRWASDTRGGEALLGWAWKMALAAASASQFDCYDARLIAGS